MIEATPPADFAAARDGSAVAPWPESATTLRRAWADSRDALARVRERLVELPPGVETMAVFGSLGRMEALPHSDLDLSVVVDGETSTDPRRASDVNRRVWEMLESLGFAAPEPEGVFAEPTSLASLTDPSQRGRLDESPAVFGKRLQLLLDAQPVVAPRAFVALQDAVLAYFGVGAAQPSPYDDWSFLLGELQRYRAALAVRYQWLHGDDPGPWRRLNLKARFSRTLNLAGLLVLLGESSRIALDERRSWLLERLRWTPLERLAAAASAPAFETIATCYERFLAAQNDAAVRGRVGDSRVPVGSPLPEFDELVAVADTFATAVADVVGTASAAWHPRFRARLLV